MQSWGPELYFFITRNKSVNIHPYVRGMVTGKNITQTQKLFQGEFELEIILLIGYYIDS